MKDAQGSVQGHRVSRRGQAAGALRASGDQFKGQEAIEAALARRYSRALTLSADLPGWLRALGVRPMFLGLDLRGGIHVLIDVDMDAAVDQALNAIPATSAPCCVRKGALILAWVATPGASP